jgi:hypothetical protein
VDGVGGNVVLIAAALTLAEIGPGPLSLNEALGSELHGPAWALAALLGGIAGAAGAHLYAERTAPPAPPTDGTAAADAVAEQPQPVV